MNFLTGTIADLVQDISNNRERIKEDFIKTYLSCKTPLTEETFKRLEIVEQWSKDRLTVKWFIQERNHD